MTKNSKTLPIKVLDSTIREALAQAIKQEHLDVSAVAKTIASVTGIDSNAIAKWQKQKSTPSAAHLLTFSAFYPSGLQMILTIIGREDVWQLAVQENIPKRMREMLATRSGKYQKRGDILGDVTAQKYASPLNERQLWFLDMLKTHRKMQNKHIVTHWNVALRTAKRDTEKMLAAGYIYSVRDGGKGWFESTGEHYE
jgi:transcriptional regulator with XRE-family HTH domain